MATSVVKFAVPPIARAPVSIIVPPEVTFKFPVVDTFAPKSIPPVPASRVRLLNDDALDEKLTALPVDVAMRVSGMEEEFTPSTVIVPLVEPPIVRFPALIRTRSASVREKLPEALPSPILPLSETWRVVPAVPELIEPVELNDILLEVMFRALFVVLNVLPAAIEKSPLPFPSESELKLVVPLVVRFEVMETPFPALTVSPWNVESEVSKFTEEPEVVAFKVSAPNWSLSEADTPSTEMLPLFPFPIVRLPAVILLNSVEVKLIPQDPPQLDVPRPMVVPDCEARRVVPSVPLLKVLFREKAPAVMDKVLFPLVKAEARVKVPPSSSVSASMAVAPAEVN